MVVAGAGQDKIRTNNIVHWSGVGINLGTRTPEVGIIQTGVNKVLNNSTYKTRAMEMSKNLDRYDFGIVFDEVIQGIVRNWTLSRRGEVRLL
jgi:UDP:flavonoid glycosyltransferase YjiC (YdhE family)